MRIVNLGALIKNFVDTFTRDSAESQPLERSSNGSLWQVIRGTWTVSSNKLYTSTSSSEYPIAVVDGVSSSVNISIKDMSQGTSTALWVTDSGNWWGLGIDQEVNNSCGCTTCTDTNYNSFYYACGSYTYYVTNYYYCCNVVGNRYCSSYNISNCKSWYYSKETGKVCTGGYNSSNCASYNTGNCNENPPYCIGGYSPVTNTNYCVGYAVSGYYTYTCGCYTCYPQYVRLIQSVSDSVSTIVSSFISNSLVVKSIKALVRGNSITAEVYENTDLTGKIGPDLVYEPTGVALTSKYGILVKPSSYNQGNSNGEINIEVV